MDLLIGTYTEGTDALGIYGVVVSSAQFAGDRARHSGAQPLFFSNPPKLADTLHGRGTRRGRRPRQCVFLERGSFLCLADSLGEDPCHLSTGPDGQLLAVANYSTGSVVVFILDDEGGIHGDPVVIEHQIEFQRRVGEAGRHSERQQSPTRTFHSGLVLVPSLCVILGRPGLSL